MRPRGRVFALGIVCVLMAAPAASFGVVKMEDGATVEAGGSARFTGGYVFGSNGTVNAVSSAPEGWNVAVTPATVSFPASGKDSLYMNVGGEQRRLQPLSVTVTPSTEAGNGVYTVKVQLKEADSEEQLQRNMSQARIRQVHELSYTVTVTGQEETRQRSVTDNTTLLDKITTSIWGQPEEQEDGTENETETEDTTKVKNDQDTSQDTNNGEQNVSGTGEEADDGGRTLTGLLPLSTLADSTTAGAIIFLGIWAVVGGYIYRRRRQKDEADAEPWDTL